MVSAVLQAKLRKFAIRLLGGFEVEHRLDDVEDVHCTGEVCDDLAIDTFYGDIKGLNAESDIVSALK
ncbi:MAG TPA: hypothetical protein IAC04_06745 [Candidatus Coprenecus stercoravium]|uniref:Uncharacterized protein n=1 Tax=Candidatus Coprenecus stercoravium TaxID=2840735 RepID=A0A9D2GQ62_9BACT|nr:hypothetical protein [Candidatus Coprenecus stercoravium]